MATLATDKPVLVTGAGGWLASHLIYQLLERGYNVRGTVRDVNGSKYAFLKSAEFHPRAVDSLTLVAADLQIAETWPSAVEGCEYVMHVASPFTFKYKDQDKDLIKPAVAGVENVLNACFAASEPVKRIIQTSSVCSVVYGHPSERYECNRMVMNMAKNIHNESCEQQRDPAKSKENDANPQADDELEKMSTKGVDSAVESYEDPYRNMRTSNAVPAEWGSWKLMGPNDWSVPEKIKGYELSKTLAEKKAWSLIEAHNANPDNNKIEFVALCPGFVFGPIFDEVHSQCESSIHILRLLNRSYPVVPAINSSHVDVRDAALCHILAMEREGVANKRYIVSADDGNLDFSEQAYLLAKSMAEYGYSIPTTQAPRILTHLGAWLSSSIATAASKLDNVTYTTNEATHRELGMKQWRTTEGALYAHAISLIKFGKAKNAKVPEQVLEQFKAY